VNLLDSLLDAIIRLDGDALVMHAGEKPYVVTTSEATNDFRGPLIWGQVELSSRALTAEALAGMLAQFMPAEQRTALHECGATVFEVTASTQGAERFSIIAARGGEDVWLEIRRLAKVRTPAPAVAAASATDAVAQAAKLEAPGVPAVVEAGPPVEPVQPAVPVSHESAAGEPLSLVDGLGDEPAAGELAAEEFAAEEFVVEQFTPDAFAAEEPAEPAFEPVAASAAEADLEPALEILQDDPLDLPMAEEAPAMHDETLDHVAGVLVSEQAWGDDVMTEGDLGELLRASAAAMIADEAGGGGSFYQSGPAVGLLSPDEHAGAPMSFDGALDEEIDLTGGFQTGTEFFTESALPDQAPEPAFAETGVPHGEVEPEPEPALTLSAEEALRAAREAFQAAQALVPLEEPAEAQAEPMAPADLLPAEAAAIEPEIQPAAPEPFDMSDESRFEQSRAQAQGAGSDTEPAAAPAVPEQPASPRPGAVVLPLTRAVRPDGAADGRGAAAGTLQRILQLAATRGASTVYVVVGSPPMVRVDGEFSALEGEPALNASFVERLVAELTPQTRETTPAELIAEIPEVGRVRCVPFRDHRGPGIIFRMVPARAIAADQLGLASELQALSTEADGLVLVAGGPDSGRSTLLTSFVDLINRTRSDFVIALESHIGFFHENKRSFISQREVRGGAEGMAAALRSAMREDPDVLVVEDLRTPELIALALEAAHAGKLVFASITAATAAGAVERVLEAFPPDRREKALATLASTLRGVMAQVLLRRLKGGRVAAREVLVNTPAVASLILDGRTSQLHTALESGHRYGMMTFAESLARLVREGVVHPSHAFRKAPDREQFLAAIKRDGVDATIAERLA
jgi:twitching motility protein PilT